MAKSLSFQSADAAKQNITTDALENISQLYQYWASEINDKKWDLFSKTAPSASLQRLNLDQLERQLMETSKQVSNEVYGIVKDSIYLTADAVVQANNDWLKNMGFPVNGVDSAFVSVPDQTVRRLVTGQIYDTGWSLSKSIWGDNEDTLKKLYALVARGAAENLPIGEIAKTLSSYVSPDRYKMWNLIAPDGKRIYPKNVEYNSQRLARTLIQHGYQTSFIAVTEKNPLIEDYIWRANGSRVCQLCMDRDGHHYKKDELPLDHPNGMCTMEPGVVSDIEGKLADWINSIDGTYPDLDAFASNFGYEAFPVKNMNDFINKYGVSSASPVSYFSKMTPFQKEEFMMLKAQMNFTNNDKFYISYIYDGDGKNLGKLKSYYNQLHGILTDEEKLKAAQKYLASLSNDALIGVWKNPVHLSDYKTLYESGSLMKKVDWYETNMMLYPGSPNYAKWQQLYDELQNFMTKGEAYAQAVKDVEDLMALTQKGKIQYNPTGAFTKDQYSDAMKALARRFTSGMEADKFHRPNLDSIWDKLTENQQYSVWEYTQNSNPINKSLSGYHDGWQRYNFLGLGNTDLGHEDPWRSFSTRAFEKKFGVNGHKDYKMVVQELTKAIEMSTMPEGCFLVRGSDNNGLAGLLEGDLLSFSDAKNLIDNGDISQIKAALEGQVFQNHSFMSTGIAEGTGFSGSVAYKIYAPQGTKGIYAEPTSYFGNTVGMQEKLYKKGQSYSSIGGEAEVILQRGTKFRITEVKQKSYGGLEVNMEVIDQPSYFKSGLEHTHNDGATEYKK